MRSRQHTINKYETIYKHCVQRACKGNFIVYCLVRQTQNVRNCPQRTLWWIDRSRRSTLFQRQPLQPLSRLQHQHLSRRPRLLQLLFKLAEQKRKKGRKGAVPWLASHLLIITSVEPESRQVRADARLCVS